MDFVHYCQRLLGTGTDGSLCSKQTAVLIQNGAILQKQLCAARNIRSYKETKGLRNLKETKFSL